MLLSSHCGTYRASAAIRVAFAMALEAAHGRPVDRIGACARSRPWPGDLSASAGAVGLMRRYRFVVAFENSQLDGYHTEKISTAYLAGAVPIYWGDPGLASRLNERAYVNCSFRVSDYYGQDARQGGPHDQFKRRFDAFRRDYEGEFARKGGNVTASVRGKLRKKAFTALATELATELRPRFQRCIDRVAALDADAAQYRAVAAAPLVRGGDLSAGVFDIASMAADVRRVYLAEGYPDPRKHA